MDLDHLCSLDASFVVVEAGDSAAFVVGNYFDLDCLCYTRMKMVSDDYLSKTIII